MLNLFTPKVQLVKQGQVCDINLKPPTTSSHNFFLTFLDFKVEKLLGFLFIEEALFEWATLG